MRQDKLFRQWQPAGLGEVEKADKPVPEPGVLLHEVSIQDPEYEGQPQAHVLKSCQESSLSLIQFRKVRQPVSSRTQLIQQRAEHLVTELFKSSLDFKCFEFFIIRVKLLTFLSRICFTIFISSCICSLLAIELSFSFKEKLIEWNAELRQPMRISHMNLCELRQPMRISLSLESVCLEVFSGQVKDLFCKKHQKFLSLQ